MVETNSDSDVVDAIRLNDYYAAISNDEGYPRDNLTAHDSSCLLSAIEVFNILDRLRPTAMGLMQFGRGFYEWGVMASVIQSSSLGPASYIVNAVDLRSRYRLLTMPSSSLLMILT